MASSLASSVAHALAAMPAVPWPSVRLPAMPLCAVSASASAVSLRADSVSALLSAVLLSAVSLCADSVSAVPLSAGSLSGVPLSSASGWLALLAGALVWPVPVLLARSDRALRHPVVALLLWQAIGLGTGLAGIAAGVCYGLSRGSALVVAVSLSVAGYLLAVAIAVTIRTLARRRRHRQVLDLVATPLPTLPGGLMLDSATAMAYCLPGLRPRMVVTSAALEGLTPAALAAVVAHERAHLRQRHDLVVLPFVAWQAALPFLPGARTARSAVALLVEALADDAARTQVGPRHLGDALRVVSLLGGPAGEPAPSLDIRLARLTR